MILNKSQKSEVSHWRRIIKKIDKKADKRGFSVESERQDRYLAESKINNIYEG